MASKQLQVRADGLVGLAGCPFVGIFKLRLSILTMRVSTREASVEATAWPFFNTARTEAATAALSQNFFGVFQTES